MSADHVNAIWQQASPDFKEKFKESPTNVAFRELSSSILMSVAYRIIIGNADRDHHASIKAMWYGSVNSSHPLHELREGVQGEIANLVYDVQQHWNSRVDTKLLHLSDIAESIDDYLTREWPSAEAALVSYINKHSR